MCTLGCSTEQTKRSFVRKSAFLWKYSTIRGVGCREEWVKSPKVGEERQDLAQTRSVTQHCSLSEGIAMLSRSAMETARPCGWRMLARLSSITRPDQGIRLMSQEFYFVMARRKATGAIRSGGTYRPPPTHDIRQQTVSLRGAMSGFFLRARGHTEPAG